MSYTSDATAPAPLPVQPGPAPGPTLINQYTGPTGSQIFIYSDGSSYSLNPSTGVLYNLQTRTQVTGVNSPAEITAYAAQQSQAAAKAQADALAQQQAQAAATAKAQADALAQQQAQAAQQPVSPVAPSLPPISLTTQNAPITFNGITYMPTIDPTTKQPTWGQYSDPKQPGYYAAGTLQSGSNQFSQAQTQAQQATANAPSIAQQQQLLAQQAADAKAKADAQAAAQAKATADAQAAAQAQAQAKATADAQAQAEAQQQAAALAADQQARAQAAAQAQATIQAQLDASTQYQQQQLAAQQAAKDAQAKQDAINAAAVTANNQQRAATAAATQAQEAAANPQTTPTVQTTTQNGITYYSVYNGNIKNPGSMIQVQDQDPKAPGYITPGQLNQQMGITQVTVESAKAAYVNPKDYFNVPGLGQVQTTNPYGAGYQTSNTIEGAKQAAAQQANAKAMSDAAGSGANGITDAFAELDKFVGKVIPGGWGTIATIAGSMIAGPMGAAIANATAGAIKGETPGQILQNAALAYAMAYGTEALQEALSAPLSEVQTGLENGTITPSPIETPPFDVNAPIEVPPIEAPVAPEVLTPPPVEPNIPVSNGPVNPVQPRVPTDLTSTGLSDSAPGTIYTNADGTQDIVLNSGKTVNYDAYQAAQQTGQPISVDGMMTTGGSPTVTIEPAPPEFNNVEPMRIDISGAPYTEATAPVDFQAPEGFRLANNAETVALSDAGGSATTLPNGDMAWLMPSTGAPVLPEVVVTAAKLGLTTGQVMALGGAAAAVAAVASMGSSGAAAAANTAMATPTPVAPGPTPVTPGPVTPPVVEPPVVEPPVTPGPVTPPVVEPPVTPGPVTPPVVEPPVTPGPVTPPVVEPPVTPPVVEPPVTPLVVEPPVTPPVVEPPVTPVEPPPTPPNEVPVIDKSVPYTGEYSNESVLSRYMSQTLTYGDILKLVAIGMVAPTILNMLGAGPQTPAKKGYGPLADLQWGTVNGLTQPGLNPGYMTFGGHPPPMYQTTNPVQSQYYWGMHPYMQTMENLGTYNNVPEAPATPFGIQQQQGPWNAQKFINETIGTPQYQAATQGSGQTPVQFAPATSYGGATMPVNPSDMLNPTMAPAPTTAPAPQASYNPQQFAVPQVTQVPAVPQVNMNFTPVTVPATLPDWAPGQWDLTQPVNPYGTTPVPAKV